MMIDSSEVAAKEAKGDGLTSVCIRHMALLSVAGNLGIGKSGV